MDITENKNSIMIKMFNWIKVFDYKNTEPCSYTYEEDTKSVRCDCFLPKLNIMLTGYGEDNYEACYDVAQQASKLINKYLEDNPLVTIKDIYTPETHKILFDLEDKPMAGPNNEVFRSLFMEVMTREELVRAFVEQYKKTYDDDFGFYFQAISKSVFPKDADIDQISQSLIDGVLDQFKDNAAKVKVRVEDDLFIVTAKLLYKSEYTKKKGDLQ